MITIALVDDHTIVRSGFAQLLNLEQDIRVQGEYESAKAAFMPSPKRKSMSLSSIFQCRMKMD